MANATSQVGQFVTAWGDTKHKPKLNSGAATYYTGAMVGRDAADSYVAKFDDTQSLSFDGLIANTQPVTIDSTDAAGAARLEVDRPWAFTMAIAAAAAGDEGRKVYATFDNKVQYAPTTYGNYAGKVIGILNSTTVMIAPPWSPFHGDMDSYSTTVVFTTATRTLVKWDMNKVFLCNSSSNMTVTLPAVATVSPGDKVTVINVVGTQTLTLAGSGAELIGGSNTLSVGTTQYTSRATVVTDGTKWYQV